MLGFELGPLTQVISLNLENTSYYLGIILEFYRGEN